MSKKYALLMVLVLLVAAAFLLIPVLTGQGDSSGSGASAGGSGSSEIKGKPDSSSSSDDSDKDTSTLEVGTIGLPGVRQISISGSNTEVASSEQAQELVNEQSSALGIAENSSLDVIDGSADEYGNSYYQLTQQYQGIPVYGVRALLEVSRGQAEAISGNWADELNVPTEPEYAAQQALTMAAESTGSTSTVSASIVGTPTLVIYVSNLGPHLAWSMTSEVFENSGMEKLVVDAVEPKFLLRMPLVID